MFRKARIKLTAWYLVIIMIISLSFSTIIYFGVTREFDRILRIQQLRIQYPGFHLHINSQIPRLDDIPGSTRPDPDVIDEARTRVLVGLGSINVIIFILSAMAAYFLAGRTLIPIKKMVDDQNRFITDASHELNTPLTSLKTSIEVNLRDKKFNLKKAKNVLKSNLDDLDSLQLLSDELIGLAKYQKPNGHLNFEKILLAQVINDSIRKLKPMADKKNISISLNVPKIYINGDIKSMSELFVILIDNAIKYSQDKKSISISASDLGSRVVVIVRDNGIGIAKEDLPLIFERFYRIDKSRTKQNVPGYGLGLSIAKRIVVLHKGTIEVESTLNKGTTFSLIFPKN